MKPDFLPSPGFIPNAQRLLCELVRATSYVETMADLKGGKTEQAQTLTTCLAAVNTAINGYRDTTAPAMSSITADVSDAPKKITITYTEGLTPDIVPVATSWVSNNGGVITAAVISGKTVILTTTSNITAGAVSITYTQPDTNGVRDSSGVLAATQTLAGMVPA